MPGAALVGTRYQPPYPNVDGSAHRVVAAGFVQLDEGTGIVHMAPAFGAEDLEVGRREGWPLFNPVDEEGRFTDLAPEFVRGRLVKEADPDIIEDLRSRRSTGGRPAHRAHLPVVLAVRHAPPLLPTPLLVHPDHGPQGRAARRQRVGPLVPAPHPARAVRGLATEQRRLVAVPRALLGDAAPHLALRRRTPDRGRVPRRAVRGRRAGRDRTSTRTGPPSTRSSWPAGSAVPRLAAFPRWATPGSTPGRCRSPSGATRGRGPRARTGSSSSSPPTSSPRASTRPAAGSTRSWPRGSCCSVGPRTAT